MEIKNRTLNFTVKENNYSITYPTVGQYFAIEAQKSMLSAGQYGGMVDSPMKITYDAIELINIVAILKVLCPNFTKDLSVNVSKIEDIDAIDFRETCKVYRETIQPWYENWYKLYSGQGEENK